MIKQQKDGVGIDVYGHYYRRKGIIFRPGNCIKVYTRQPVSKGLGDIVNIGKDDIGRDYIIVKEILEGKAYNRRVYLCEIYE